TPPPAGTLVAAPREVLETAVSVLVDNAFRYTPRGGSVALSSEVSDGSLRLAVRDTGPGVDADDAPRVFERMFRGRAGKASGGGFGLGLALARRLARSVRGEVALENPGEPGARFSVRFPLGG
ncbi:MAG TPA: ATP-binding protein, partial [Planctomycetota bacterium]|nr:ATP-binding protein [Planctomycetota bacterium]